MQANRESSADAEWWRHDDRALWEVGQQLELRRRADYVSQVEVVAELWIRSGRAVEDRRAVVAGLMCRWGLTRGESRELLRYAELFRSEAVREAARAGV